MNDSKELQPIARRDFLGIAGIISAGLAVIGSILGMIFLLRPKVTPEVSSIVRVGAPEEFTPGMVKIDAENKVRVIATKEGIAAMSLVCTHLGCIVKEDETGFTCPCHGSVFDKQGNVQGGPAPRALYWLAVSQAPDGTLLVDAKSDVEPDTYFTVS